MEADPDEAPRVAPGGYRSRGWGFPQVLIDMGRGLSDLQKAVLRRAGDQHDRRVDSRRAGGPQIPDASYFEVLADAYGWEPWTWHNFGGQHFSLVQIGESPYRNAVSALARACARFEARGLVRRVSWGVMLTEKGVEKARELAVAASSAR